MALYIFNAETPQDRIIVNYTGPTTVQVSWQAVQDAERYIVTFTHLQSSGYCSDSHNISIDVGTLSTSIGIEQNTVDSASMMLRAYTTYSITVASVSNETGSSVQSESVEFTTMQTGRLISE